MKWSILILTMPERRMYLDRLLKVLYPQIEKYRDIEIITRESCPSMNLGENRKALLTSAAGEYVNFIDDDDLVPKNYVQTIHPLLNRDYVGFPVTVFRDGTFLQVAYHSLRHKGWSVIDNTPFRDISHLNPMKKELAVQGDMSGGHGEDMRWASSIRNLGIVQTEHYVPESMYFYYMRSKKTCESLLPA